MTKGKLSIILLATVWKLAAQPGADDVVKVARDAMSPKLASVRTLTAWGSHHGGRGGGQMSISLDLAGMFLVEHSTLTNGGEIQRASGDGSSASGGMPGDDGGPALALGLAEGLSGGDYWARNGSGIGKRAFTAGFLRYALALTMSAPGTLPLSYAYGGRLASEHGVVDAVECKGPDDFVLHLYLDAESHLPVTMVYHEGGQEVQLWLKDYKAEGGIRLPHLMTWLVDGSVVEQFQIQHVKLNPKLKPEIFRK